MAMNGAQRRAKTGAWVECFEWYWEIRGEEMADWNDIAWARSVGRILTVGDYCGKSSAGAAY
jgi:hypothetical protein